MTTALEELYPKDPPRFLSRIPHGYHDAAAIERDLKAGGFRTSPQIHTVAARSRAASARAVAVAYCQGSPLYNEIEAQGDSQLAVATDAAAQAIADRFGSGPVDGKIRAHIVRIIR